MKKKFKKATPVTETKPAKGSVGEFIELLGQFPSDAKLELEGIVDINDGDITIKPIKSTNESSCDCEPFFNFPEDDCDSCDCDDKPVENVVLDDYFYGMGKDSDFMNIIRHESTDHLIEQPITLPNNTELQFEGDGLYFPQVMCIDEIRQHNMHIAELMAELHRRELAALLEYNTQCLAHFGIVTNKCMCTIIDPDKDINTIEF